MLAWLNRFPQSVALLALLLLGFAPAAEDKRLAIYSPQTNFTVAVVDHQSREYVSVTDLLDPFGRSSLTRDGKKWRLTFEAKGKANGEFSEGSEQAKIRGKKITLSGPFWVDGQRGYVPVNSSLVLLGQLVGGGGVLRGNSRRLFLDGVTTTYSVELQKSAPAKLVLHFSSPVNPSVSTEPGRVRLIFTREPIVSAGSNPQRFDDGTIHTASFVENNGTAELTITTSAPLQATFSDGGKTIALSAPPPAAVQLPLTPATPAVTATTATAPQANQPAVLPAPPRFLVVIDPAHGGEDAGATLASGLFEKEVTLAIARRLKTDLEQRGVGALLLRDSDSTVSGDQRSVLANGSRAMVYVSIHAASLGSGMRVYTARFPSDVTIPAHGFVPWDTAQAKYLNESNGVVASLVAEFEARKMRATHLQADLQPLRQIAKPAVAIEIAPPSTAIEDLRKPAYQQSVATAIGASVASMRGTLAASLEASGR